MIVRDLSDTHTLLIRQGDHADLSAQIGARWGNSIFSRPEPRSSVILATAHHDDHFRDIEWVLPIDASAGRPHGHRTLPFSLLHLDALRKNILWLAGKDPYASLLVSMHHSGLPQNRYGVIKSWRNEQGRSPPKRPMRPEIAEFVKQLELDQAASKVALGLNAPTAAMGLTVNYRLLQAFDLLSLYLCSDGYQGERLGETTLDPVPTNASSSASTSLHLTPLDDRIIRVDPFPFEQDRVVVSVLAREMKRGREQSDEVCRDEYWRSEQRCLTWTFVR